MTYIENMISFSEEIIEKFNDTKEADYFVFTLTHVITKDKEVQDSNNSLQILFFDENDDYVDCLVAPYGYQHIQPVLNEIGMMKMFLAHSDCTEWSDTLAIQTLKDSTDSSNTYVGVDIDFLCDDCYSSIESVYDVLEEHISLIPKEEQEILIKPFLPEPSYKTVQ
jgi:hypothetical protein